MKKGKQPDGHQLNFLQALYRGCFVPATEPLLPCATGDSTEDWVLWNSKNCAIVLKIQQGLHRHSMKLLISLSRSPNYTLTYSVSGSWKGGEK